MIGAAIEVHRHLGPGFFEAVYEESLAIEFGLRGIPFERQQALRVVYKGSFVGEGRVDFVVGGSLIVEIKAVKQLTEVHTAQVMSYLKAAHVGLGLLLNFKEPVMRRGVKRVVWSRATSHAQHRTDYVQKGQETHTGLVVPSRNTAIALEPVKEDLDAIA